MRIYPIIIIKIIIARTYIDDRQYYIMLPSKLSVITSASPFNNMKSEKAGNVQVNDVWHPITDVLHIKDEIQ